MGKKSTPKAPTPPDPAQLIALQSQYNRVGQSGPFGSARYSDGPNGGTEIHTELSPQMQELMDNQFRRANTESTRYQLPSGFSDLQAEMMKRVAGNVGNPHNAGMTEARRVLKNVPTRQLPPITKPGPE